ncbi:MAG: VanZ family protein [Lachnospiraceae bacterium]
MTKKKLCFRWILFVGYLLLLSYFLFFAEIMGRTNLTGSYHYNLIPFLEIRRFIVYRKKLGMLAVLVNLLGNVAAFLPFGFFLPTLSEKNRSFFYVTLMSFEFSLLIECIQLFSKVGSFDVDDMILNTLGGSIGFLCFLAVRKLIEKNEKETKKEPKL